MEEATFAAWHKNDGDTIAPGDPLFALESDKATQDVEAIDGGVLRWNPDSPKPGDTVKAGQAIGFLVATGEPWPPTYPSQAPSPATTDTSSPSRVTNPGPVAPSPSPAALPTPSVAPEAPTTRVRISPRALRVAEELGVDWRQARPTGITGRIRERDVRALVVGHKPRPATSLRQRIADRLVSSLRESAPVTLHTTIDATQLVAWKERLKSESRDPESFPPTYTDLLLALCARALQQHPTVNARWESTVPLSSNSIHIGIAVDTDAGLLVPVVRDVPVLSLTQLSRQTRDLAQRARKRTLTPDEMQGGTFTVTNLGTFGIDHFTPIINPPECAILGIGRIHRRPAVVGDRIVPQDQISLSLTFDHRAMDGAPAARFLQSLSHCIERAGSDT